MSYGKKEANSSVQTTKFDMHSSVETIFALGTDLTKNIIGGVRKAQSVYGTVKNIASIIPGTSYFEDAVKKAKAVDGVASATFNFLDKLTDKVETINETTESKKVSTGYLTNGLSLVDSLFDTDLAKVPEGESGPTYTRKESSAERIDCPFPLPYKFKNSGSGSPLPAFNASFVAATPFEVSLYWVKDRDESTLNNEKRDLTKD